jgi:DNA-binding CsgD family transcriptional regulator/PAS domain-containing protein
LASRSSDCALPRSRRSAGRKADETRAPDVLFLEQLHEHLPVGLLVNDAETLEILHASPTLLEFAGAHLALEIVGFHNEERDGGARTSELAAMLAEVAMTGSPRHLPELSHETPSRGPRWWSLSLYRIDTDRWGRVVLTLGVDVTDQVLGRKLLEERERRRVALQQAIAAAPGQRLVGSLQHVVDVLVPTLSVDIAAIRLLDENGKLHLAAAAGFRPDELRTLALKPLDARRVETMIEGGPHPLAGPLGLRRVEIRWLKVRDDRIGTLTIGARSERRLSEDDLALLEIAAAQLSTNLERIERTPHFLRSRSLELSRASAEEEEAAQALANKLRPRELAILRLYGEGLATHQIAELLVLSVHTVRTHVKNALRRLSVSSRSEAIDLLKHADSDPAI